MNNVKRPSLKIMTLKVLFCTTGTCLFIIYRSTIYRSIDRDKQEKKEAESRRKVDKVELVLQLSWLERYTDNVEVGSSTLPGTTKLKNEEQRKLKAKS